MAAQLQLAPERRSNPRYPVTAAIEYRIFPPDSEVITGAGTLVDMSNSGVLIQGAESLPDGAAIELFIAWPAKLNVTDVLELYVNGTIVRTHGRYTGVEICESEFRVRARATIDASLPVLCHS